MKQGPYDHPGDLTGTPRTNRAAQGPHDLPEMVKSGPTLQVDACYHYDP